MDDFKRVYWSTSEAVRGDRVHLIAELTVPGQDGVRFEIFEHDADGSHESIGSLDADIDGPLATASWVVPWVDDYDDEGAANPPEFFFEARSGMVRARSELLRSSQG